MTKREPVPEALRSQKCSLECKMFVSKYYFEQEIKFSYLVWNVNNYKRMKQGVWYVNTFKTNGWHLKLIKTDEDVRLLIHCKASIESITCYISPSRKDDVFSIPYDAHRIGSDNFELRIHHDLVRDPTTKDPEILGIYFRYSETRNCWKTPSASRGIDDEEKRLFTNELASMLETGRYSDCTISTPRKKFNLHKIVLSSRSEVLKKHFVEDCRSELISQRDVSTTAMEVLLRYIYSGKLDMRKLEEHDVCEVLKLATEWNMGTLELRCVSFLRFTRNLDGKTIREMAEEKGARLSEKTRKFLKYVKAS